MIRNETARFGFGPLILSAGYWAAALLIAGSIGWLGFVLADDTGGSPSVLAAVVALTAAVGIAWLLFRARARKRLQAAMDAYADREIRSERRRKVLKRVRTLTTAIGSSTRPSGRSLRAPHRAR